MTFTVNMERCGVWWEHAGFTLEGYPPGRKRCRRIADALQFSFNELPDKSGVDETRVRFRGFDGNNESESLAFAKYYCEDPPNGRYTELGQPKNSHAPMWQKYDAMLAEWSALDRKAELSASEINRIVSAKP